MLMLLLPFGYCRRSCYYQNIGGGGDGGVVAAVVAATHTNCFCFCWLLLTLVLLLLLLFRLPFLLPMLPCCCCRAVANHSVFKGTTWLTTSLPTSEASSTRISLTLGKR